MDAYGAGVTYGLQNSRRPLHYVAWDWWSEFVRRYGWRAYALPVLFIITIAALVTPTRVAGRNISPPVAADKQEASGPPPLARSSITLKVDQTGTQFNPTVLRAAALPPGGAYTRTGTGTFRVLPGASTKVGSGKLFRYSVDVENGVAGVSTDQFAGLVMSTLADPRSWTGHGYALQRVDGGRIDFHISLTSSLTVRKWCGYDVRVEASCYQRADGTSAHPVNRVVLNVSRWIRGSTAYVGDLDAYRLYMINHEDGHALGRLHAHQCLPGGLAPVMMQQTLGLRSARTGQLCAANPWPYPPESRGAPGAEQQDSSKNDEYHLGD